MPNYIGAEQTAIATGWHIVERVWHTPAHATANIGDLLLIEDPDAAKGTPRAFADSIAIERGYVVNSQTFEVLSHLPAQTSPEAQRAEIVGIVRNAYRSFDFERWHLVDTTSRPIKTMIFRWLRMLLAYNAAATTNPQFDAIKTEARKPLAQIAQYANASAWNDGLALAGFRVWTLPQSPTDDSVSLPNPLAAMPTLSAEQIAATDVAAELR